MLPYALLRLIQVASSEFRWRHLEIGNRSGVTQEREALGRKAKNHHVARPGGAVERMGVAAASR